RYGTARAIVSVDDKHFHTGVAIGDTTLISMYGFQVLHGNKNHVFINDQSAAVTEGFAMKFFGKTDVIDQHFSVQSPRDGRTLDFIISAVLSELPYNNSITNLTGRPYDVFVPMHNNQYFQPDGDKGDMWTNMNMLSLVELKKETSPADVEVAIAKIVNKYQPARVEGNVQVRLDPIKDYYLRRNNEAVSKMIVTLLFIAAFIMLMTIINFVNIHIGTSSYRLKEIGLRKVFGGAKGQLIIQHLIESLLLTCLSLGFSLVLYELLNPLFSQLLGTKIVSAWTFGYDNFLFLLLLVMCVSMVSGVYPAFVLSSIKVIQSVKGKITSIGGKVSLRKGLLVTQFSLAIITFISALTISRQVEFIFSKDLGFSKEQIMIVQSLPRQWDSIGVVKMEGLRTDILRTPHVRAASLSYHIPDGTFPGYVQLYPEGNENPTSTIMMTTDYDFADVYGLTMLEGTFMKHPGSNNVQGHIVLNESAMNAMGWTSAVGKTLRLQHGGVNYPVTVSGVVKDFHHGSMQATVQPLVFSYVNDPFGRVFRYFSIKIDPSDITATVNELKEKWGALLPESGFEYTFMDDRFQAMYTSELQLKKASSLATVLMLLIMLLGIFGVVAFTLSSRTKEIAIRKVLGAKAMNIIILFIRDYAPQILVANIFAWPVAFFITNYWLQGYAYRVAQSVFPFALAAATMLTAAFVLIAVQCMRAAVANPIKDLKSE
ncbi:MAG TPA: FtsX-like permease family protein, partial [Cyclobacteriaceae bacterium]|nr:FtsX-like permease family protein [Cyclobacteriaceae bacterium]